MYLGGTFNLLQEFTIQGISMRQRKVKRMCVFRRVDASLNRSCAEAQVCLLKLFPERQLLHCILYQQSDTPRLPEETGRPQVFLVASFLAWPGIELCSDSSQHRSAKSLRVSGYTKTTSTPDSSGKKIHVELGICRGERAPKWKDCAQVASWSCGRIDVHIRVPLDL